MTARISASVAALVLALLAMLGGTAPAGAIPGGGADPDTPGTSSSVSPRTLRPGETIRFSVRGFPAGEIVNIKIDDGQFCAQAGVHGACVVHQQRIGRDGTVSGSFALPVDLAPGEHWLRYLASAEVFDDGEYAGVRGYTLRGGSAFTVVAGGPPASSSGTGEAAEASSGAGPTTTTSGGVVPVGEVLVVPPGRKPTPTPTPAPDDVTAPATDSPVVAAHAAAPHDSARFPVVGTAGLLVLVSAAAALLLRARRATS